MTNPELTKLHTFIDEAFKTELFRLETQQYLSVHGADATTAEWLAGGTLADHRPWEDTLRREVAGGMTTRRVLTIDDPPTDYLLAAIGMGYLGNVRAGELVRVLDRPGSSFDPGGADFWLIENERVAVMHYGETGTDRHGDFLGFTPITDEGTVARYREMAAAAWDAGTDLTDWWRRHDGWQHRQYVQTTEDTPDERRDTPPAAGRRAS